MPRLQQSFNMERLHANRWALNFNLYLYSWQFDLQHYVKPFYLYLQNVSFLQCLVNVALDILTRIHTIPTVPIVDCFQKIRQQVKCYLQLAGVMGKNECMQVGVCPTVCSRLGFSWSTHLWPKYHQYQTQSGPECKQHRNICEVSIIDVVFLNIFIIYNLFCKLLGLTCCEVLQSNFFQSLCNYCNATANFEYNKIRSQPHKLMKGVIYNR